MVTRTAAVALIIGSSSLVAGYFQVGVTKSDQEFKSLIFPMLDKYCGKCHGGSSGPGGFGLSRLSAATAASTDPALWQRVSSAVSRSVMPLVGQPQPTAEERKSLVDSIEKFLKNCDVKSPGRVTMRRLNRAEYDNTVRDLFGVDFKPAEDFPSDEVGYGFDNNGDVLSLSPLLMEKYLRAAEKVAEAAVYVPVVKAHRIDGEKIDAPNSNALPDGGRLMFATSEMVATFKLPVAGKYKVRIQAFQTRGGDEDAKLQLNIDGKPLQTFAVAATAEKPQLLEREIVATSSSVKVGAAFVNDFYDPAKKLDRNLAVKFIELEGPLGKPVVSPTQLAIVSTRPTGQDWKPAERGIFSKLAPKVYRRPATSAEIDKLVSIAELAHRNGESFDRCIQLGITAMLVSPSFLFRVEHTDSKGNLDDFAIATRLSYFLWSTTPDQTLLDLAMTRHLNDPAELRRQVKRMLADFRATALADNFAAQWLQFRKLETVSPDRKQFGSFTSGIRRAMEMETKLFFQNIASEDKPVTEFLSANYSFINGALANYYGIAGIEGSNFRRVDLPANRVGILTQASVLTVTSNPTRTSPVKRGKWILENILNAPTPPPPPNVGVLKDDSKAVASASVRQRLEAHRNDPACANCHKQMDGLGFALENFDAIGRWRTKDGAFPIDATGELPGGIKFDGPVQLRDLLLARKDEFVKCLAEKLLTYGIGRGMELPDNCNIDDILARTKAGNYRFSALVEAIVQSEAFRMKKVEK